MNRNPHIPCRLRIADGFSLIELVIVVVIIGIIAAVAVPRMSRGSQGAAVSALAGNLSVLNKAVDHYAAEHGGAYPTALMIESQLTGKTTDAGAAWSEGDSEIAYGPYLRAVPPLPVGARKGQTGIATTDGDHVGWIYRPLTGKIRPNLSRANSTTDEDLVTLVITNTKFERGDLVAP